MRRSILISAGGLALALVAGPVLSQAVIGWNGQVQGRLGAASEQAPAHVDHAFSARAGQRLEAVLRSQDFDAYLELRSGDDDAAEPLAMDDDGLGEGTDSRLRAVVPADGTYRLRAGSLGGAGSGGYSLTLTERPPAPPAPRPTAIRIGQTRRGELTPADGVDGQDRRHDPYSVRLRAGERIAVAMETSDEALDPVVRIGRMEREGFVQLAENDDGPGRGLNAYLVFTAPRADTYVIQAAAVDAEGQGAYSLSLSEAPEPAATRTLTLGQSRDGELRAETSINAEGQVADTWRFRGQAGQRIAITLASQAFDAVVELFSDPDGARESLGSDDDGAGPGTDSRLVAVLPSDGDYLIEARSLGGSSVGAYRLSIEEVAPDPLPLPLALGQTLEGEITDADPIDGDGRRFDAYSMSGAAGNRIRVILRSGDFDAFVQIGRAGEVFESLAIDDDGLGQGTDAQLDFTLPDTGDYVIQASPLTGDTLGLYSVELSDRGFEPTAGSLIVGATARGTLSEFDATGEDGSLHDAYALTVADGDKLRLTMVSNDFDAMIEVGKAGDVWVVEAMDDDGLADTHARLDWTVEEGGDYIVRARSYGPRQTGAYALTVEPRS